MTSFGYQVLGFGAGGEALPLEIEYLVVAGGGAGGKAAGGGGGAGGYSAAAVLTLTAGIQYTVTVGDGGPGADNQAHQGADGSDSVLSGTGIVTVTSGGGGGGSRHGGNPGDGNICTPAYSGRPGGSGGGAGGSTNGNTCAGAATGVGTGFAGGIHSTAAGVGGGYGSGGGGGAGAVGGIGYSTPAAGDGGVGLANDIVEATTDVYYAGGGGGCFELSQAACGNDGAGANGRTQGGGGKGATYTERTDGFCDAAVNTGGGGGGRSFSVAPSGGGDGGTGGKGIVVLRMLSGIYSGTTTGSPTESTDGAYKVLKFTGTGSYTA